MEKYKTDYNQKGTYTEKYREMIINSMMDYDIYFVTFTFNRKAYEPRSNNYVEFFKKLIKKLDVALLSNSKSYIKKHVLYLFPELNPSAQMPGYRFHGFLCIHKNCSINFDKKCVERIVYEHEENTELAKILNTEGKRQSIRLKQQFEHPFSKVNWDKNHPYKINSTGRLKNHTDGSHWLSLDDYRIYPVTTEKRCQTYIRLRCQKLCQKFNSYYR